MIYPQLLLDLHDELIVDLFAGGGGASCGLEMALGRQVDVAVNHDEAAVAMHEANHPQTRHYRADVFEVCPYRIIRDHHGRPIGLLWLSPDCTFHSKARGSKPIRDAEKRRRALAWVGIRWAGQVRPRVVILENVEEFADWGPLVARRCKKTGRVVRADGTVAAPGEHVPVDDQQLVPDPARKGETFRQWVRALEDLGYEVEWRELRACDYGAPTIRKRLFVVARCDGQPIVWPEPTHGDPESEAVKRGELQPYRTAAECIDWTEPMCSIFATREEAKAFRKTHGLPGTPVRPLAENTMRRIARGVMRYVVENPEPFVLKFRTGSTGHRLGEPLHTITANGYVKRPGGAVPLGIVAPTLAQTGYGERDGQKPRSLDIEAPLGTVVGSQKHALVSAFLAQNNAGFYDGHGRGLDEPNGTVLASGSHQSLVAATLAKLRGTSSDAPVDGPLHTISTGGNHALVAAHLTHNYTSNTRGGEGDLERPLKTITSGQHAALVAAFITKYYSTATGQAADVPLDTATTADRFGLVTVTIKGQEFVITDICLRMLQPRELYNANGFPPHYVIDVGPEGRPLTKTEQVQMCGNAVPPDFAAALAAANVPELAARREAA